jgi:hypothetical protein
MTAVHACAGSVCRVCGPGVTPAQAAAAGMAIALHSAQARPWRDRARAWLNGRTPGETFTADDLVAAVGLPSGDLAVNGNGAVGAVIRAAAQAKTIRPLGYVESTRPSSHGRPVRLWQRAGGPPWLPFGDES